MGRKRRSDLWEETVIWASVLGASVGDVGVAAVRGARAILAKSTRYAPHALLVFVACVVLWVLSEWHVEGAFKPLPNFIQQWYVWHFVVVR